MIHLIQLAAFYNASNNSLQELFIWLGILAFAVLFLGFLLIKLRERILGSKQTNKDLPFTLSDLEHMRNQGHLTEIEYRLARKQIIGLTTGERVETSFNITDSASSTDTTTSNDQPDKPPADNEIDKPDQ